MVGDLSGDVLGAGFGWLIMVNILDGVIWDDFVVQDAHVFFPAWASF